MKQMMIYERKLIQKDIKGSYQAGRLHRYRREQKTTSNAGGSESYIQFKNEN